jgi:hypothetical protein
VSLRLTDREGPTGSWKTSPHPLLHRHFGLVNPARLIGAKHLQERWPVGALRIVSGLRDTTSPPQSLEPVKVLGRHARPSKILMVMQAASRTRRSSVNHGRLQSEVLGSSRAAYQELFCGLPFIGIIRVARLPESFLRLCFRWYRLTIAAYITRPHFGGGL